ncbi:hypothetical protein HaLaN_18516 [Haematococcus lacustris]|uniref:Uncharacterized protein n=1 Tax=Haematococcus lacustris TaxID=44745 RepID=A0A699ZFB9_HAELA|nr:hypothetical protein HaLaN_18516 [Haematococcus lacustris]
MRAGRRGGEGGGMRAPARWHAAALPCPQASGGQAAGRVGLPHVERLGVGEICVVRCLQAPLVVGEEGTLCYP